MYAHTNKVKSVVRLANKNRYCYHYFYIIKWKERKKKTVVIVLGIVVAHWQVNTQGILPAPQINLIFSFSSSSSSSSAGVAIVAVCLPPCIYHHSVDGGMADERARFSLFGPRSLARTWSCIQIGRYCIYTLMEMQRDWRKKEEREKKTKKQRRESSS